ncbi:MAG: chloride channel protein [Acidimicrobiia bacterium]|jgi:H+/Cl- antiporter ClcA
MLPFGSGWYRRLLGVAVVLGLAGGVFGLIYIGATDAVIDLFFGDAGTAWWSGEWWWIPLIAAGGLTVAALRQMWRIPEKVPGGVELIESGHVDETTAPQWAVIAAVSAMAGASLGPSFALVVMGGGLASWIANRRWAEGQADQDYTLTGISGAFGAAFTSPILGAFLVSELAPTRREHYVAAFVPQLIAASIGFVFFYAVVGRTFLGSYELPAYEFRISDMAVAVALGVLAAVVMAVFVVVLLGVKWVTDFVPNPYVRGLGGGALVGLIAVALPLTLGAGQSQLGTVVEGASGLGIGLLSAALIGKMIAMALSLRAGFMGGNVFPLIFIGGTAGALVYLVFPDIPFALAMSCMLAAVPGSYLRAPVSLTFIAAIAMSLGPESVAPVAVAVVTSYLVVAVARYFLTERRSAAGAAAPATAA